MRQGLRDLEIADATAVLAAKSNVTIFHLAFTRWLDDAWERPLTAVAGENTHLFAGLASDSSTAGTGDDSY